MKRNWGQMKVFPHNKFVMYARKKRVPDHLLSAALRFGGRIQKR
jgi:hypothetical protein